MNTLEELCSASYWSTALKCPFVHKSRKIVIESYKIVNVIINIIYRLCAPFQIIQFQCTYQIVIVVRYFNRVTYGRVNTRQTAK